MKGVSILKIDHVLWLPKICFSTSVIDSTPALDVSSAVAKYRIIYFALTVLPAPLSYKEKGKN